MTTRVSAGQIKTPPGSFYHGDAIPATQPIRHPGRIFVGEVHQHGQQTDGNVTGGSFLQSFASTGLVTPVTALDYWEDNSRNVTVSKFGAALVGVSQNEGLDGIGVIAGAIARFATKPVWGAYIQADRIHASAGTVNGAEIEASQIAGVSPGDSGITEFGRLGKTPYKAPVSGQVTGLALGAGSDAVVYGRSYAVDAAINIGQNGAAYQVGVNFMFDSIMREGVPNDRTSPGNAGYARAMALATEQGASFYSRDPSGGVGSGTQEEVVRFFSNVISAAHRSSLFFSDDGLEYRERTSPTGHMIFRAAYNGDVTAGVQVVPGYTGSPAAVIEAFKELGGDANLIARGAGTGLFGFGTWTSNADTAINGYITIVDRLGNTRKLATIA